MGNSNLSETEKLASKICRFIWDNYRRSMPLQVIAQAHNLSPRLCRRIITNNCCTTFPKLKNCIRMYHTVDGFTGSRKELQLRAIQCGFRDENAFRYWWKNWSLLVDGEHRYNNLEFGKSVNNECLQIISRVLFLVNNLDENSKPKSQM